MCRQLRWPHILCDSPPESPSRTPELVNPFRSWPSCSPFWLWFPTTPDHHRADAIASGNSYPYFSKLKSGLRRAPLSRPRDWLAAYFRSRAAFQTCQYRRSREALAERRFSCFAPSRSYLWDFILYDPAASWVRLDPAGVAVCLLLCRAFLRLGVFRQVWLDCWWCSGRYLFRVEQFWYLHCHISVGLRSRACCSAPRWSIGSVFAYFTDSATNGWAKLAAG